jgi:hypothetical protein
MIFLRSSATVTEKKEVKEIFEQKIAKITKSYSLGPRVAAILPVIETCRRLDTEEVAPGAGCFFFVTFAIFCVDDFSSLLRH